MAAESIFERKLPYTNMYAQSFLEIAYKITYTNTGIWSISERKLPYTKYQRVHKVSWKLYQIYNP